MRFDKKIFELFNRDDFTYRRGDEEVKNEYLEGIKNWEQWCTSLAGKVKKFDVPNTKKWQNSGNLSKYFWTRLKYTPYMNSSACISLYADSVCFVIELAYELKNENSVLSIKEFNELILHNLEQWVNRYNVDKNLFYIGFKGSKCTLEEYFNTADKASWSKDIQGTNLTVGVHFSSNQISELDTESDELIDILKKLSFLYEIAQKPNPVYEALKSAAEIIPDEYDGSYELVRETVKAYENVPYDKLTLDDLDAMFFMCIGTFKHGVNAKKQQVEKSNLPETEKNRILTLIDSIHAKAQNGIYENTGEGIGHFGMFGEAVGSLWASYKENDDMKGARDFITLCININKLEDEEQIFSLCEKVLKAGVKGMQTGKISKFLHCLKPYIFPIINEKQGMGTSIYEALGITLNKPEKAVNYIENAKAIKKYRDTYFTFKNYRIMDIVDNDALKLGSEATAGADPEEVNPPVEVPVLELYTKEQFLEDAYIDGEKYDLIVKRLDKKKNIILQGAPGVGKSYLAKKIAYSILGAIDEDKVQMIQFHQSYSYEDFIMGYRPNKAGGFDIVNGAFYKFCKKAIENPDEKYFFIIDEINRGNLSKIFGELMLLIEADKRGESYAMSTVYSEERFYIPENLHIIGLMNTADRSIALIDYALRRRFSFIDIEPAFGEKFVKYTDQFKATNLDKVLSVIKAINDDIEADESLGKGFKIGHSYFSNLKSADSEELLEIIDCDIIPLLEEYWFESTDKVRSYSKSLHEAALNE